MGEFNDAKMHFSLNEQQQKQMAQLEVGGTFLGFHSGAA
jgi:hypothetical protein